MKKPEVRLTLPQIITFWVLIAGMMVLSFFFGLHAGLERGGKRALDQQDAAVVRLPIIPPQSGRAGSDATGKELSGPTNLSVSGETTAVAVQPPVATQGSDDGQFDFSGMVLPDSKSSEPAQVAPGLSAKSTESFISRAETQQPPSGETKPAQAVVNEKSAVKEKPVTAATAKHTQPAPVASNSTPHTRAVTPTKAAPAKAEVSVRSEDLRVASQTEAARRIASGYYVQVAAPSARGEAQRIQSRLQASGIRAEIQEARVNGALHFRVLAGPASNRQAAESVRARVGKAKVGAGSPFVRYIQ